MIAEADARSPLPPPDATFSPRPFTREDRQALFAVLALAIVLYGFLTARLACLSRDGVFFIEFAQQLADDPIQWLGVHLKQPGFSYLLLGVHKVLGPLLGGDTPLAWQRCGQLVACLGGIASCALIFLLARRLFDTTIAFMAGLLAVCWPAGGHLSADVLSDMPHLALYLAAFLMAHRAMQMQCARRLVACGVFAGAAYWMRQEALGIVAASAMCWMWPGQVRKRKERWIGLAVLLLCFAIVVAPQSIASGRLMPGKSIKDMIFGHDAAQAASPTPQSSGLKHVGRASPDTANQMLTVGVESPANPEPFHFSSAGRARPTLASSINIDTKGTAHRAVAQGGGPPSSSPKPRVSHLKPQAPSLKPQASSPKHLLAESIPWHLAPARMAEAWGKSGRYVISTLFLLCLFLKSAPRAERSGRRLVLLAVALQVIAVQLRVRSYGEISSRYMVIPLALSIPWAAAGLLATITLIAAKLRERWPVLRPVDIRNVGLVVVMLPMLYYLTLPPGGDRADYRAAGQWLYDNADPADVVIAHDRLKQVMFYAGRTYPRRDKWIACKETDGTHALAKLIRRKHARWLVDIERSRREAIDETAHFAALEAGKVGRLSLVQTFGRAHIYQVAGE